MTKEHPINPPTHMYHKWIDQAKALHPDESWGFISGEIARLAYQAGADAELQACCQWICNELGGSSRFARDLQIARRGLDTNLKQQALEALSRHQSETWCKEMDADIDTIRRALEALPDE